MQVVENFGTNNCCSICKLPDIDVLNYGEIHRNKDISVHLFCLYFSSNLPQRGEDTSGIVGFELHDIRKLIKNSAKVRCCYCNKVSATTHCHHRNCGRVFHQVCGYKADARFEYLNEFRSFCDKHNQMKNENENYPTFGGCWICYEALGDYNPVKTIPSCCGKWLHQGCLRKYAINSGYCFFCPLCRNKKYVDFARSHGIYVPQYEALWENTHNYSDIEHYYKHCDANECLCPNGRKYTKREWKLQLCSCCGSYGLHELCRPKNERKDIIVCEVCLKVHNSHTNEPEIASHQDQMEVDVDVKAIDLTNEEVNNERQITTHHDKICGDLGVIDLTQEKNNVVDERYARSGGDSECLKEKYAREKAERPIRNEMRQYRIYLWFRDWELYKNNQSLIDQIDD